MNRLFRIVMMVFWVINVFGLVLRVGMMISCVMIRVFVLMVSVIEESCSFCVLFSISWFIRKKVSVDRLSDWVI